MDLTPYVDALRADLTATASAGDEQTRHSAAILSAALEPSTRLILMNALADLAAEVTSELPHHIVDVRLDGRDVRIAVNAADTGSGTGAEEPPRGSSQGFGTNMRQDSDPPPATSSEDRDLKGDISRMTLRLFEQVKNQAEQAAAAQGVSLNTFVARAVQGAVHPRNQQADHATPGDDRTGTTSHLHGWVQT